VDICGYPDSGKIAARERRPDDLWEVHRSSDFAPYWLDESAQS
jgi:hypothetical protein